MSATSALYPEKKNTIRNIYDIKQQIHQYVKALIFWKKTHKLIEYLLDNCYNKMNL